MGNKKLWLAIVLLFVSGALFGEMRLFQYVENVTEQEFSSWGPEIMETLEKSDWSQTGKLPNTVIHAIDYSLNDYSLEVGDIYAASYYYNNISYGIFLRMTDVINKRWAFYAWLKHGYWF